MAPWRRPAAGRRSISVCFPAPDRLNDAAAKGRAFLRDLLNPTLNLLPEFQGSSAYWLYHDNYLAAKVMERNYLELARKITKAIGDFNIQESGKIGIVFGEAKWPLPFRQYQLKEVRRFGSKVIKT